MRLVTTNLIAALLAVVALTNFAATAHGQACTSNVSAELLSSSTEGVYLNSGALSADGTKVYAVWHQYVPASQPALRHSHYNVATRTYTELANIPLSKPTTDGASSFAKIGILVTACVLVGVANTV